MIAYYVNMVFLPLAIAYVSDKILYNREHRWKVTDRESFWRIVIGLCSVEAVVDVGCAIAGKLRALQAVEWFYTPIVLAVDVILVCGARIIRIKDKSAKEQEGITDNQSAKGKYTGERTIIGIIVILGMLCYSILRWYELNFNVSFEAVLYTVALPTEGATNSIVWDAIIMIVPLWLFLAFVCLKNLKTYWKKCLINSRMVKRLMGNFIAIIASVICIIALFSKLRIVEYVLAMSNTSQIYEDYYVKPTDDTVQKPEKNRNLILVYMESMENTYCDLENGGVNGKNYIPNLTTKAQENVSFSNGQKMGGAFSCRGTDWTIAATIATSSGVTFAFPIPNDPVAANGKVAAGLVTLGDLLEKDGYNLEVILGSAGSFAGEGTYYRQHGGYKVFDYSEVVSKGYVPGDFYEWWGVRDEIVYRAAKDEIASLAEQTEPFAVSIFTMDTHSTRGYICPICRDEDDEPLGNVLLCADRQINEFVEWCQKQPFYEDTTIVIIGDHPRMDNYLVGNLQPYQRTTYNCIINGVQKENVNTKNRCCTTLDYFPTILSSMGYQIKGDRLGLGTDLFSDTPTLSEEFGLSWLNEELAKKSKYYIENFY